MAKITRSGRVLVAMAAVVVLAPLSLVGCGERRQAQVLPGVAQSPTAAADPVALKITPKDGAGDLPISTEIGTKTNGEITGVTLTAAGGEEVPGEFRADGSSWVPARPLAPSTRYTAAVTAAGAAGDTTTAETTFTTMSEPGARTGTGLYMFDDAEYGVAMPVVVEFVNPVPEKYRAGVQRRMFVTTDPPQPGVWHWVEWGTAAYYRAPDYWEPGTKISVRIALAGHPTGDGRYGDADRSATATIADRKLVMKVRNKTKQLSVFRDGELIKKLPVSLGKKRTPSSYGHMVVMSKERTTVFDTFAELGPQEGYRVDIEYAMRLTWGGEFMHAAPWSVADQGVRNVSHGCVNMSMDNARWLFKQARIGDPVIVTGTEVALEQGNGWTAWDLSWNEFIKGSALPVPEELATA